MIAIGEMPVQDIWLLREDDKVVVYVQIHGKWYEAIREIHDSSFSHNITANGLEAISNPASKAYAPVQWASSDKEEEG